MPGVAALGGFGQAARWRRSELPQEAPRIARLGRLLAEKVSRDGSARINGHAEHRLHALLNVASPGVDGEALLLKLARAGVVASTGSSCAQQAGKPSRVLTAMGIPEALAQSSVLFSLGPATTEADVERTAEAMARGVAELRALAPRAGEKGAPA